MEITQEQYHEIIRRLEAVDQKITSVLPAVEQNTHAIFGYNGTPGVLAWQQTHANSCISCGNERVFDAGKSDQACF